MPSFRAFIGEMAVMVAIALVLAALGPFGSFALGSFALRLAYWLPATLGGYAIVRPVMLLVTWASGRLEIPLPLALAAGVLLSAVPLTAFIFWLNGNPLGYLPSFEGWFQVYLQVALIGAAVTFLFWLMESRKDAAAAVPPGEAVPHHRPAPTSEPAPFLARLPPHLRGDLVALQMEDHYVRAYSGSASVLVLIRMRDAVAELASVEGMRVHRSWWVARDAVEQVEQDGRSIRLTLRGGVEAPVARSMVPAVKAAGWLSRSG